MLGFMGLYHFYQIWKKSTIIYLKFFLSFSLISIEDSNSIYLKMLEVVPQLTNDLFIYFYF